jgi:catechol 2,3-dioxygenase-like lactoylglutathione lyase family enzyme
MMQTIDRMLEMYEHGRINRRTLIAQLAAAATGIAALATDSAAHRASPGQEHDKPIPGPTFAAIGLNHIALSVTDVPRSRAFYERHLGMTLRSDGGANSCFLNCGPHFLALFRADKPAMHHYCYSIEKYDPDDATKRLEAAGLKPRQQGNRVYFDDPDGLVVQIAAG